MDLIGRPAAAADVEEAFSWYEQQRPGLGKEFLDTVDAALREIAGHPLRQRVIFASPSGFAGATLLKPKTPQVKLKPSEFSLAVGRALRRAGRRAHETARMHGTSIYISRNGKVVAVKP